MTTDYNITYATGTIAVAEKSVTATVTASNKVYDGTDLATTTSCSLNGVVDDNDVGCAVTSATFSDSNVGTGKNVTANVALTGTSSADYTLASPVTTTANITALPITVTATTSTKVYDGNTSSTGTPTITSTTTLATVDTATYSQVFNSKDVADATSLTPSIVIDGGSGNANYNINLVNATGSITPATASVTASGTDKVYDGTTAASTTLTVNGAVGGDVLTATYGKAIFVGSNAFNGKNIGTHPISVTGIAVTGPGVTSDDYTYNTSTSTSATITAKALTATIIAPNKTYDGTASSTNITCNPVGNVISDLVQCTATNGTFSDKNVGQNKIVTADVSFTSAVGNYSTTTSATTTANITALNLVGTITASNKTYDGTTSASTSCSLSGVLFGDDVSCVTANSVFSTRNAGTNQSHSELESDWRQKLLIIRSMVQPVLLRL